MSENGIVRVSKIDLTNWRAQIEQALETYNTNKQRVQNVITSIENGDMAGDPADAFLKAYEQVKTDIEVSVPKEFDRAITYLDDQIHKLGVTVDNIVTSTKF